ncbi:hypothetical protein M5D96_004156 [Drosophila gunungcola]|uniref:Uncharacterized protein n=1 Tax=Drosophila gunungcola TaxID=103775 RepID=A0A9P9YU55_9MUSC|nr:hypothetical protein M5D96_004156 [Drosophila gunungcola]
MRGQTSASRDQVRLMTLHLAICTTDIYGASPFLVTSHEPCQQKQNNK